MGQMGYGYGSECHLLRWMGRHQNAFNQAVRLACGKPDTEPLHWLDGEFDPRKNWPDRELTGIEFIADQGLQHQWKQFWPQTGQPQNWDAVGRWREQQSQHTKWLLVEAKANLAEIRSACKAVENGGLQKIRDRLQNTAHVLGANYSEAWMKSHYQLANRLAFLNWLHDNGHPAQLLFIYFIGDLSNAQRVAPQSVNEWSAALTKQKNDLGLPVGHKLSSFIRVLFLHVSKPEAWLSSETNSSVYRLSGGITQAVAEQLVRSGN